jgi:signal transduction histidine kinase
MKKDKIAIVGAGVGGTAILKFLLKLQNVEICYICDIEPNAPGILLAKKNNIKYGTGGQCNKVLGDLKTDLIFEVTGDASVFEKLREDEKINKRLISATGTKIIFDLLDAQDSIQHKLEEYKNGLEDKIIERTDELEKSNLLLQEEMRHQEQLNQKLQQINNEKTKYLLQATHQLKAPFAAIQSYVDIILDGYTGGINQQTAAIMQKIKTRCDLLSTSIKEMLELANLKSYIDHEQKNHVKCQLESIIREVIGNYQVLAQEKNIQLSTSFQCHCPDIFCHVEQIKILLSVLIDNAIKYTPSGKNINVETALINNKVVLKVKDQGIGIKSDYFYKVFKEYFRSNRATEFNPNGTGLGLAIANEIVKLHDFKIEIESTVEQGSTFSITMN